MSKKHTQTKQADSQYEPPVDAIAQDLASLPDDERNALPKDADGKPVYPPIPDPFGADKDALAGVERLRSHRFRQFWLRFAEKPPEEVIAKLKEHKYRWAPKDQAWVKPFKHEESYAAALESERLYEEVRQMLRESKGHGREL
jgi:hypothetical protein